MTDQDDGIEVSSKRLSAKARGPAGVVALVVSAYLTISESRMFPFATGDLGTTAGQLISTLRNMLGQGMVAILEAPKRQIFSCSLEA